MAAPASFFLNTFQRHHQHHPSSLSILHHFLSTGTSLYPLELPIHPLTLSSDHHHLRHPILVSSHDTSDIIIIVILLLLHHHYHHV